MPFTPRHVVATAMLAATPVLAADSPKEDASEAVKAIFVEFDVDATERLLADDYIQHSVDVPTGAAQILGFIPALEESGIELTMHRTLAEDDLVVFHTTYETAQAFGRTQTSGETEVVERDKTAENKALVTDCVDTVLKGSDASNITDYVSAETCLQHNSDIADGLDGLGSALASMADQGIELRDDTIHMVVAEGNFVFTASEGTFGVEPTAFFYLFRVADGRIVEHWDTITTIPPDEEMAHTNGKFGTTE